MELLNYTICYKKSDDSFTAECELKNSKIQIQFNKLAISDRKMTKIPGKHWDVIFHNQKKNRPFNNESLKSNFKPDLATGLVSKNVAIQFLKEIKPNLIQIKARNEKHADFWYDLTKKYWIEHERNKLHPIFLMRENNIIFLVSDRFSKYVQQTL
jgi:hypothetical protein